MTEPAQPADHPPPEQARHPVSPHPNGIPPQADSATPKGLPTSDRHDTETAAKP